MTQNLKSDSPRNRPHPYRYQVLYDQAAKEYAQACKRHNRSNIHGWKTRLEWLDRKIEEVSE